jgi:hypothetical protein
MDPPARQNYEQIFRPDEEFPARFDRTGKVINIIPSNYKQLRKAQLEYADNLHSRYLNKPFEYDPRKANRPRINTEVVQVKTPEAQEMSPKKFQYKELTDSVAGFLFKELLESTSSTPEGDRGILEYLIAKNGLIPFEEDTSGTYRRVLKNVYAAKEEEYIRKQNKSPLKRMMTLSPRKKK